MLLYAIIPVAKVADYVKDDTSFCRHSLDNQFLVWDQDWDNETLLKLQADPDVKLLSQEDAILEMKNPAWTPEFTENVH